MKASKHDTFRHWFILIMILVLSVYLRLWNVQDNPRWYTDEATHIEIAQNLLKGEIRYFAIEDSWLLFARLPLFEYVLAGIFRIFGTSIGVLRGLTGILGIITTSLLYFVMRDISTNKWFGLLVSASFTLFPQAILYNRFGFSYNLLLPLIVLILWEYYHYRTRENRKCLVLSAVLIGIGCISDVIMWSFIPTLVLITWGIRWRDAIPATIVAIIPLSIYALIQFITVPDAFLFDLGYTLNRTGGGTFFGQSNLLIENYLILLKNSWWIVGIIGIFLIEDKHLRYSILILLIPLVFVGRTVPLYSLSAYYVLPFLPLIAIGVGSFLRTTWHYAIKQEALIRFATLILVCSPITMSSYQMIVQVRSHMITLIDDFLIDADDAYAVADFINTHSDESDLVVASAPIGCLLDTDVAEFQMSAVSGGLDAVHIPGNLPENRFAFSTDYRDARYIVIDDLWRRWGAVHIPQLAEMMEIVQGWELIFEAGSIQVYENLGLLHS